MILRFWSCIYGPAQQWLLKAGNHGSPKEFFKGILSFIYLGLFGCCSPNFIVLEDLRHVPTAGLTPVFFALTSPNVSQILATEQNTQGVGAAVVHQLVQFQEGQKRQDMCGLVR